MNITLAGDWHGNVQHMRWAYAVACRHDTDVIVQLGDFGFGFDKRQYKGTGGRLECVFTHQISKIAQETGIPCYWLDGNHENFDLLEETLADLTPEEDGTYQIAPMVFYIPRGTAMTWGGKRWLCCGGAVSVDKLRPPPGRVPYISWWPQEAITDEDVETCRLAGQADIVLSHDMPFGPTIVDRHLGAYWGEEAQRNTEANQTRLTTILENSGARELFHGHLHIPYTEEIINRNGPVVVTGLNLGGDTSNLYFYQTS